PPRGRPPPQPRPPRSHPELRHRQGNAAALHRPPRSEADDQDQSDRRPPARAGRCAADRRSAPRSGSREPASLGDAEVPRDGLSRVRRQRRLRPPPVRRTRAADSGTQAAEPDGSPERRHASERRPELQRPDHLGRRASPPPSVAGLPDRAPERLGAALEPVVHPRRRKLTSPPAKNAPARERKLSGRFFWCEAMPDHDSSYPHHSRWLHPLATVEGWLALILAVGCWGYLLFVPVRPMVGMPVESFLRDIRALLPAPVLFAFALAGIRLGTPTAKSAAWLALALFLPLILVTIAIAYR